MLEIILERLKLLTPGSGYTHRKLRVKDFWYSTIYNTVSYKNHGFETGETVLYSTTETEIDGLNTTNQYQIEKLDPDTFRVINVGIGGTDTTDSVRNKHVDLIDSGSGFTYSNILQLK